jgi:uncharacterized protein YhhL (DUF1145 family)
LYSWNLKIWGENDLPQWNALFGVSFIMFLNLGFLSLLFQFFGVNIFLLDPLPKTEIVIILLSLFVINYFLFIHNGNYLFISKELKKESPKNRRTNTILLWLYIIISFALFAFGAIYLGKLKGYH